MEQRIFFWRPTENLKNVMRLFCLIFLTILTVLTFRAAEQKMSPKPRKYVFKHTPAEKELDAMYAAGQLTLSMGAKQVFELTEFSKKNVECGKFENYYYNWRRAKLQKVEEQRTGGIGPPNGKNSVEMSILTRCYRAHLCVADPLAEESEVQVVKAPTPARKVLANIGNLKPPPFVSVTPINKNVASNGSDNPFFPDAQDTAMLHFVPPTIVTVLKNEKGQRIIELCFWLQSGLTMDQVRVFVCDDMKTLKFQVRMDSLMQNGTGLHMDLVPRDSKGKSPSRKEIKNHVRVHHWNSLIDEMRSGTGLLPCFSCDIALPEEVCSKKILRESGKASGYGSKILLVDLLVEDSKTRVEKRCFELITDEVLIDDDQLTISTVDD